MCQQSELYRVSVSYLTTEVENWRRGVFVLSNFTFLGEACSIFIQYNIFFKKKLLCSKLPFVDETASIVSLTMHPTIYLKLLGEGKRERAIDISTLSSSRSRLKRFLLDIKFCSPCKRLPSIVLFIFAASPTITNFFSQFLFIYFSHKWTIINK